MDPHRTIISTYTWGVLTAGALMIFGAIWWASSSGPTTPRGIVYAQPPNEQPLRPAPMRQAATPAQLGTLPDLSGGIEPGARVTPFAQANPAPRPAPVRHARRPGSLFPDMFPVRSIAADAPRVAHPYREVPELFPSFFYDEKMWSATGTFARADQVGLAPIGREMDGRSVYALRDTASHSAVLFVPSSRDPNKYAIYR